MNRFSVPGALAALMAGALLALSNAGSAAGSSTSPPTPIYSVTSLYPLVPEMPTYPQALNNLGQVTGYVDTAPFAPAAYWDPTRGVVIPPPSPPFVLYDGYTINDLGQLGGDTISTDASGRRPGYIWDPRTGATLYPSPNRADEYSAVQSLNDLGQALFAYGAESDVHSWLGSTGGPQRDLGNYLPVEMNGVGQALVDDVAAPQAFIFQPSRPNSTSGALQPLGHPSGSQETIAFGLNLQGTVAGSDAALGAFLWDPAHSFRGLAGGSGSYAANVNDAGQAVGVVVHGGAGFAAVWKDPARYLDLNTVVPPNTPHLNGAITCNNRGQVLAFAGETDLYLLSPPLGEQLRNLNASLVASPGGKQAESLLGLFLLRAAQLADSGDRAGATTGLKLVLSLATAMQQGRNLQPCTAIPLTAGLKGVLQQLALGA